MTTPNNTLDSRPMAYQPVENWYPDSSLAALARIFYDGGMGFDEYRTRRKKLIDAVVKGEIHLRESPRLLSGREPAVEPQRSGSRTYWIGILLVLALAATAFVLTLMPQS